MGAEFVFESLADALPFVAVSGLIGRTFVVDGDDGSPAGFSHGKQYGVGGVYFLHLKLHLNC